MTARARNRKVRYGLSLAIALAACSSQAIIPEPDAVIHGKLHHRFGQSFIPNQPGEVSVIARVNGTNLITADLSPGDKTFLLRIPMDDGIEPRLPNTAKAGDQVELLVQNNQTMAQFQCVQQPLTLPGGRAPVVQMNLFVEGNVAGVAPDVNHNGVPDFWDKHFRLLSPKSGQRCSNAVFTVQGSADGQWASVMYQLNGGAWLPVSTTDGFTNWTADVTLLPGTNWIKTYATDAMGNYSPTSQVSCFYVVPTLLTVNVSGSGTVSPNYNGQLLEIGRSYSMTAMPGTGQVFSNWVGGVGGMSVLADTAKLNFMMQSNLVLQANFIANPFAGAKGAYTGLYHDSNNVQQANSGFFRLTLTEQGAYSGSLRSGSKVYPLSGKFSVGGTASRVVGSMTVNLALDLIDGTRLSGTVNSAELQANRSVFNAVTRPATNFAGKYTMIIPGAEDNDFYPEGDGYATVNVDKNGIVRMVGSLADGTPMAQVASVSRDGQWPLYVSLYYGGKGSVLGWMTFTNSPDDLTGWLRWVDPAQANAKVYRDGFTNVVPAVAGSRYIPVGSTVNALNLTSALMIFDGGNLSAPFTNQVTFLAGKVTNTSPNKLTMTVNNANGTFAGSVTVPGSSQSYSFKGAVLTNENVGSGYFLGTNQSGRVYITAP